MPAPCRVPPQRRARSASLFAALLIVGCSGNSDEPRGGSDKQPNAGDGGDAFECADPPVAYVFPDTDATDRAMDRLDAAGFDAQPLPLDKSPFKLRGLIVIPSYASEDEAYDTYMARYAADLYAFVDSANVLLQLPQATATEASPPFLPTTQSAERGDLAVSGVGVANPNHALLATLPVEDGALPWTEPMETSPVFTNHGGFETLLYDTRTTDGLLLEGAYGQGRMLLSALAFDTEQPTAAQTDLADAFFANLLGHVDGVCHRTAEAVSILASKRPDDTFEQGSQVLAVLSDTQVYALWIPGLFSTQTQWLRDNVDRFDIRYVVHLGDIVNNNTPLEWERAAAAMSLLDGVVPYAIVPGNHDYGPSGDASTRDTLMNDYFSFETTAALPSFGGAYEDGHLDNTYHLLEVQGRQLILIALEWGPRDEVIEWANQLMDEHPDREGILVTHAYLYNNNRRYDHTDTEHLQYFNPHDYATPGVNDGEELWQKLVRHHRFIMTLNGHVLGDGVGYLASTTDVGNTCHQMLSNYQFRQLGGEAYMRLLEFMPDGETVRVFTYSPLYDAFLNEHEQNFTITLDPSPSNR